MGAGRRVWLVASLLAYLGAVGCRSNQQLLESELRAREIQYHEAMDELKRSEFQNEALQRELNDLRRGSKISPEDAARTFGLKRITIGRGTMGVDHDKVPGDEALQVQIEPRDGEDHVVKTPGTLQIIAMEISPQGVKSIISVWDIDQAEMRKSWKQGLFSTGYQFILPWKSWPQYENLRVLARLMMPDGRVFEADKDIKIRIPPGIKSLPSCPTEQLPNPPEIEVGKRSTSNSSPRDPWQPALPGETAGTANTVTFSQSCRWQPVPLRDSPVQLGRPEPFEGNPPEAK